MPIDPDYVDVAERITTFYEKWPEGRLVTKSVSFVQWPKDAILAVAHAYRTPDDPLPGVGTATEPVPGPTNFTRNSEVQNAETSAWGRAIVACGIKSKKVASANEVRNRQPSGEEVKGEEGQPGSPKEAAPADPSITPVTEAQGKKINALRSSLRTLNREHPMLTRKPVTLDQAKDLIDDLKFAISEANAELPPSPEPTLDQALMGVSSEDIPF